MVERAIAQHDAVFEQIKLKNMSASKLALRSKTFESNNLENTVPTAGANRFVPQAYRVRRPDGNYSATPNTGRISIRGDRANHEQIVAWSSAVIDLLDAPHQQSASFIRKFARSLDLNALPRQVRPTFVAFDVSELASRILDADAPCRLVRIVEDDATELDATEVQAIIDGLDAAFPVHAGRAGLTVRSLNGRTSLGTLKIGKTRLSFPRFNLPQLEGIFVEGRGMAIGQDPEQRALHRYIDREDLFLVLFNDLSLAYVDGTLFRDEAILGGGDHFLRHLHASPSLTTTTSEKGVFEAQQTEFSPQSVFRVLADELANDCDTLICDDLGDEWADFIGISAATNPKMVSFYHAKHGDPSLGASPFHEAVGQALKNLGRMTLSEEAMPAKFAGWTTTYRNAGVQTSIARILRGTAANLGQTVEAARSSPDLVKRVFIVTSSLSRAQVAQTFADAAAGHPPPAHFVQLYWLLTNYFSSCLEMGATGYVICRP